MSACHRELCFELPAKTVAAVASRTHTSNQLVVSWKSKHTPNQLVVSAVLLTRVTASDSAAAPAVCAALELPSAPVSPLSNALCTWLNMACERGKSKVGVSDMFRHCDSVPLVLWRLRARQWYVAGHEQLCCLISLDVQSQPWRFDHSHEGNAFSAMAWLNGAHPHEKDSGVQNSQVHFPFRVVTSSWLTLIWFGQFNPSLD